MKKENNTECNCGWCKIIDPLYISIHEKLNKDPMWITNGDLKSIKENLFKIKQYHQMDYEGAEQATILLRKKFEAGNN